MAIKTINIGNVVNDGTGDDLRSAFAKVNENFTDLNNRQAQDNTASNVGTGAGLFKEKVGSDLRFKSITADPGLSLTNGASTLTIVSTDHASVIDHENILHIIDFGGISTGTNAIQFILQNLNVDFGTIVSPSSLSLDAGSIV
jgi:hypothetical protein